MTPNKNMKTPRKWQNLAGIAKNLAKPTQYFKEL